MMPPDVSVVVPVYGCACSLRPLVERIDAAIRPMGLTYEIVMVHDGSPDDSWAVLESIVDSGSAPVVAIRLSRNFGQHPAITAGLAHARGHRAIVMDCDLQDPPEVIPALIRAADEGAEIVFGRRTVRKEGFVRRTANNAYFWLLNRSTGARLDATYGTFSLLTRTVIDAYLSLQDQERHYLFILNWLGFRSTSIEYEQHERETGQSGYSLRRLLSHALSGVFFQTAAVLRWIVYLGFFLSFSGVAWAIELIIHYELSGAASGWTSLAVLLLVLTGTVLTSTGIAALYIGKTYEQVKQRPLYVIAEEIVADDGRAAFGSGDRQPVRAAVTGDIVEHG